MGDVMSEMIKLLQASIDMLEKDREIAALKQTVAIQEARIAIMECKLQRRSVPFAARAQAQAETPALLRLQAG
jgi:hypothetical protein